MIPRYSLPEMADAVHRRGAGSAPGSRSRSSPPRRGPSSASCRRTPPAAVRERAGFDVAAIDERELITEHDVAAFVDVVQERVGQPEGTWVHYGLTSSDVVDTALSLQLTRRRRSAHRRRGRARRARSPRRRTSTATRRWSGARTASTPSRRRSASSSRSGRCRCAGTSSGCAGPATVIAVGKLSGAVGTYSNVDPFVEQHVCERLGLTAGAGDPGAGPRPPRRAAVRVRERRREHRAVRDRDPPPPAHRGARGGGAVPGREAEGLLGDAAQAQPGEERAAQRAGPGAARQPRRRARERRAVARARHLALVGRADHPPRLVRCSRTTCS